MCFSLRGDRREIHARRQLGRLEPEGATKPDLIEEVVLATIVPHRSLSRAPRRSARPRRSWTPTVEAGRPVTCAISSTLSSLK